MNWNEIQESLYWEMLEALPPAEHRAIGFLLGEASTHRTCAVTARYVPVYRAFVCLGGKPERFFESEKPMSVPEFRRVAKADVLAGVRMRVETFSLPCPGNAKDSRDV